MTSQKEHLVYECYVLDQLGTFRKFTDIDEVLNYVGVQVRYNGVGAKIVVGIHNSSEYQS